ncbi:hypothetical protein [Nocardioides sp.]|uniref:hypothetical protein n=1 Tax=Nocardioides sp. TaxID=35761 RepID=UPI002B26ABDE|nr:hypothetical protein [Nocardioides sp.]
MTEIAERAGVATGRRLTYVEESLDDAHASRRAAYPDEPDWQIEAWVSTYTAIADGSCAEVATGRARGLEDVLTP